MNCACADSEAKFCPVHGDLKLEMRVEIYESKVTRKLVFIRRGEMQRPDFKETHKLVGTLIRVCEDYEWELV